jgi:hypothetical protein
VDSSSLTTALATHRTIKYNHAEPKKTDVKVIGERTRTEETNK